MACIHILIVYSELAYALLCNLPDYTNSFYLMTNFHTNILIYFILASEIGTLFLVRRRLQEMYDDEEKRRRVRNTNPYERIREEVPYMIFIRHHTS